MSKYVCGENWPTFIRRFDLSVIVHFEQISIDDESKVARCFTFRNDAIHRYPVWNSHGMDCQLISSVKWGDIELEALVGDSILKERTVWRVVHPEYNWPEPPLLLGEMQC